MAYRKHNHDDYEPEVWDDVIDPSYSIASCRYSDRSDFRALVGSWEETFESYGDPFYHDHCNLVHATNNDVLIDRVKPSPKKPRRKIEHKTDANPNTQPPRSSSDSRDIYTMIYYNDKVVTVNGYKTYEACPCIVPNSFSFITSDVCPDDIRKIYYIMKFGRCTLWPLTVDTHNKAIFRIATSINKIVRWKHARVTRDIISDIMITLRGDDITLKLCDIMGDSKYATAIKQLVGMYMYAVIFKDFSEFKRIYGFDSEEIGALRLTLTEPQAASQYAKDFNELSNFAKKYKSWIRTNQAGILDMIDRVVDIGKPGVCVIEQDSGEIYTIILQYMAFSLIYFKVLNGSENCEEDEKFRIAMSKQEEYIINACARDSITCKAVINRGILPTRVNTYYMYRIADEYVRTINK